MLCKFLIYRGIYIFHNNKNNLNLLTGSAIRCYECNSHNDTRCAQDKPVKELLVECSDHKNGISHTLCRKITQVIEFSVNSCKYKVYQLS